MAAEITREEVTARLDDIGDRLDELRDAQKDARETLKDSNRQQTAEIRSIGDLVRVHSEKVNEALSQQRELINATTTRVAVIEAKSETVKAKSAPWLSLTSIIVVLAEIIRHLVGANVPKP